MQELCAGCGASFEAQRRNHRFCSDRCRNRSHVRSAASKPSPPKAHSCVECGTTFIANYRPKYCSAECRTTAEQRNNHRRARANKFGAITCAVCNGPMWSSQTTLPQGQATCRPCRRANVLPRQRARSIPSQTQPRVRNRGTTLQRGYGYQHVKTRRLLLAALTPGTPCELCHEPMNRSQMLDLDHSDPASRLRGEPGDRLTHSACNRREGARRRITTSGYKSHTPTTCIICGCQYVGRPDQRTCGRSCGQEMRRRNAA